MSVSKHREMKRPWIAIVWFAVLGTFPVFCSIFGSSWRLETARSLSWRSVLCPDMAWHFFHTAVLIRIGTLDLSSSPYKDFTRKVMQQQEWRRPGGASLFLEKSIHICVNQRPNAFFRMNNKTRLVRACSSCEYGHRSSGIKYCYRGFWLHR